MEPLSQPSPGAGPGAVHSAGAAGAIIVAAGSTHADFDPCWAEISEKPALAWSVAACIGAPPIAAIALVIAPARLDDARALARRERWRGVVSLAAGGPRLGDALVAGLAALPATCRWIVLHDAARPLVTPELLPAGLAAAERTGIASACEPVKETIKRADAGLVLETLDRAQLRLLQTPQVFARERLQALLDGDAARNETADWGDAAARAAALGLPVVTFPGGHENMRVTAPSDIALLEDALARRAAGRGGTYA